MPNRSGKGVALPTYHVDVQSAMDIESVALDRPGAMPKCVFINSQSDSERLQTKFNIITRQLWTQI